MLFLAFLAPPCAARSEMQRPDATADAPAEVPADDSPQEPSEQPPEKTQRAVPKVLPLEVWAPLEIPRPLPVPPAELPPAAATQADEELRPIGAMALCAQAPGSDPTFLERVRRRIAVTACASSAWVDSLFGDQMHYTDYRATYGSLSTGALWSRYGGLDPRLRFRMRLQLPQWDERISAFAGRIGGEDYVSDIEGDFAALPTRQFGNLEDDSVLLGLGYSNPKRTGNNFDAGVGVRLDVPPDPYARGRYEMVRNFGERYTLMARQTLFWQRTEGFGTTTRLNLDRALSERMLVRWSSLGKYTEATKGVEWYTQLTLFQSVGSRTGLAWQFQVEGATDNAVDLTRYAGRLIMRRQLDPQWLFLELRGGLGWPRFRLDEDRKMSPEIGVALEMQFGRPAGG
jgi:hypothetical protein